MKFWVLNRKNIYILFSRLLLKVDKTLQNMSFLFVFQIKRTFFFCLLFSVSHCANHTIRVDMISPVIFSLICPVTSTFAENILFLHPMNGCDTTSSPFKEGKMKLWIIHIFPTLLKYSTIETAQETIVASGGKRLIISLYGYKGTNVPSPKHLKYILSEVKF